METEKILLIHNSFLHTTKYSEQDLILIEAGKKCGIQVTAAGNADIRFKIGTEGIKSCGALDPADFSAVLFWDKDIRLGLTLKRYLHGTGIKIFNDIDAIYNCDDKYRTFLKISDWNLSHPPDRRIPVPGTFQVPGTYENIGYTDTGLAAAAENNLSYPFVIKECFGSFGAQVYLSKSHEDTVKILEKRPVPLVFQDFIEKSSGVDIRIEVVGGRAVAAMKRKNFQGDFRANLTNGGSAELYHPCESEIRLALDTCSALGLDFGGVDLLFSKGTDFPADTLCEVNSNAHFKNISDCTGVDAALEIMKYIKKSIT